MIHITSYLEIIGLYIPPQSSVEDAIENVASAVRRLDPTRPAILAGDLNCRLDKPDRKSRGVMQLLEEEGFHLASRRDMMTYINSTKRM